MMADGLQDRIDVGTQRLTSRADALSQRARLLAERRRARMERVAQRVMQSAPRTLERRRATLAKLGAGLEARSPLQVFKRGFAVARSTDGTALQRREAFAAGQAFDLLLQDGRVRAITESTHPDAPHLRTDA
jgi:exodeoxyribonuclease VII large subunit